MKHIITLNLGSIFFVLMKRRVSCYRWKYVSQRKRRRCTFVFDVWTNFQDSFVSKTFVESCFSSCECVCVCVCVCVSVCVCVFCECIWVSLYYISDIRKFVQINYILHLKQRRVSTITFYLQCIEIIYRFS